MSAAYPWLAYSAKTRAVQREINLLAIQAGKAPHLKEDGKLGPNTCGVATVYAGVSPNVADMKKSCMRSTNFRGAMPTLNLPWLQKSPETLTLQVGLNAQLEPDGFCVVEEDGVMGPSTCGAAKKVLGSVNSQNMGCQQYAALRTCAATSNTAQAIAVPNVTTPAVLQPSESAVPLEDTPARIVEDPMVIEPTVTPAQAIAPSANLPAVAPPVELQADEGMTTGKWAILGLGVVAVGVGTYLVINRKKR